MQETSTPQGEIRVLGRIHNGVALNCVVTPYADPSAWFYKQFVSQMEFDNFVIENRLIITKDPE